MTLKKGRKGGEGGSFFIKYRILSLTGIFDR